MTEIGAVWSGLEGFGGILQHSCHFVEQPRRRSEQFGPVWEGLAVFYGLLVTSWSNRGVDPSSLEWSGGFWRYFAGFFLIRGAIAA